ncbi:MAG: YceD family protein [Verrucomicrobia subdivision 3 bacterium]|nr:YceD family protein [Limisphaerales bacterium]
MPLKFNIRHLEDRTLHLQGDLGPEELDIGGLDELIHVRKPLEYDLHVEKMDKSIFVQGRLEVTLECECARCLKAFEHPLELGDWACHLPLEGEEAVAISNDLIDLTPYIREDIVLAFPQHPLCRPDCKGLESPHQDPSGGERESELTSQAWSELNKLKF